MADTPTDTPAPDVSQSGLLTYLDELGKASGAIGSIYKNFTGGNAAPAAAPAPAAAQTSDFTKYLPWIGGGLALVLVLVMVMRK